MQTEFRKSKHSEAQFVIIDGVHVGAVRKIAHWSVRGNRVEWRAFRKGSFIGAANTRKGAAALLEQFV